MSQDALRRAAAFFVADLDLDVSGLGETARTLGNIVWGWNEVEGADGYEWSSRRVGGDWSAPTVTSQTSATVAVAREGEAYRFRVRAFVGEKFGEYARDTATSLTIFDVPAYDPTGVSVSGIVSTQVQLDWSAVENALRYEYGHKPSSSSSWGANQTTTATNEVIASLTANTAYDFRVRAVNDAGSSAWVEVSATTSAIPPQPGGLTSSTMHDEVEWDWDAVVGAVRYEYQSKPASTDDWPVAVQSTTGTDVTLTGLSANTEYDFRVRTVSSTGTSGWVSASATTDDLSAPTNLRETSRGQSSIRWGWSAVDGATGYRHRHRRVGVVDWSDWADTTATSVLATGLLSSRTYEIEVVAYSATSTSDPATDRATTTTPPPPPTLLYWSCSWTSYFPDGSVQASGSRNATSDISGTTYNDDGGRHEESCSPVYG